MTPYHKAEILNLHFMYNNNKARDTLETLGAQDTQRIAK